MQHRPRIVIVDDDPLVRGTLNDALVKDFSTFEISDPVSALDIITASEPDLIISDLVMPDMSGIELLYRSRAYLNNKQLPFILLSGDWDKLCSLKTPKRTWRLSKPFDLYILRGAILRALRTKI